MTDPNPSPRVALVPGDFVRHPKQPDWGLGQVQSVTGTRVIVNFEHRGKLLIDGALAPLTRVVLSEGS